MHFIESILKDSPFVQGGLTLMIIGWLGYQLRAFPARVWCIVRKCCTREIEVRERSPLYGAWLDLVTEGALRRGGPRRMEVRAKAARYDEWAASSALAAGATNFWAKINGMFCHVSVARDEGGSTSSEGLRPFVLRVEVLFASRPDLEGLLREAKRRANILEHRQRVHLCDKHGDGTAITLPRRSPETLCLPAGFFAEILDRLQEFKASREDYERVGIPVAFRAPALR